MITQASDGTWSFTHGRETYSGFKTREQAAEAQYDLEHGKVRSPLFYDLKAWIDEKFDEEEQPQARKTGDEEPFGALADGTPITGVVDLGEPGGRAGIVHAYAGDLRLTAQDEPNLFSVYDRDQGIDIEAVTIEQITALRALLATDIPEQLLAAAIAHSRGDAAPAPWPSAVAPAVRVEQHEVESTIYTEYAIGEGLTEVIVCPRKRYPGVQLIIGPTSINDEGHEVIELADLRQLCDNLTALLADPRLLAAMGEQHQPIRCTTYA